MEVLAFLMKGLLVGVSIAAPVGPIGLLCIRRTLADGAVVGFASGLGAASADAVYGAIAGFGLAAVTEWMMGWDGALRLVGGVVLLGLGLATLRARPADRVAEAPSAAGLAGAYASTFALTLANPATIISFLAVFGGLGLASGSGGAGSDGAGADWAGAAALVSGVFVGSALWWLGLSTGVGLLRAKVTNAAMLWINRVSGMILMGFGVAALATLLPVLRS